MVRPIEKLIIEKYGKNDADFPILFIVGAPRSGSTLLYQLLTNYLQVKYIDNLTNNSRETPYWGAWLSNLFFNDKTHGNFSSSYGKTHSAGLHAPAEGGALWYQWLPTYPHFIDFNDIDKNTENRILRIFNAIINRYHQPFIIKNLHFSQRLRFVAETFHNAKILFIRRDPFYIAQSIYNARVANFNDPNVWWSTYPRNSNELKALPYDDQIAGQIYYTEHQIINDLKYYDARNVSVVQYEHIAGKTDSLLQQLGVFIQAERRNTNQEELMNSVTVRNTQKVNDEVAKALTKALKKFNWAKLEVNYE
ncbi:MAG: sulfotransferase [Bacteroidales bacterium]|nr:sulfotransferase [Bacteroidales bacterium]